MDQGNRKRGKWWAGVGLLVAAVGAVAVWRAWPRERLLMEVAHPLVKADAEKTNVCWLSSHQLLIVTTEREASVDLDANGNRVATEWKGYADLLDTTTHIRSRQAALTDLFLRTTDGYQGPHRLELSPDGVWLLWETSGWETAGLDRTRHIGMALIIAIGIATKVKRHFSWILTHLCR